MTDKIGLFYSWQTIWKKKVNYIQYKFSRESPSKQLYEFE